MRQNRKSIKRQNVRVIIYPQTGQKNGKTTFRKKNLVRQEGF